jgi:glutamate-1-semialdehyde 2,1-aminomutase
MTLESAFPVDKFLAALRQEYEGKFAQSHKIHDSARVVLVDGVSHGARLLDPYPFRIVAAQGSRVTGIDGHEIIDFWQGHYANILGHNPLVVRQALMDDLQRGFGLQTGIPDEREIEYAELLAGAAGAERIRLTTAGTLATMYAIMLARAFTGRKLAIKLAGGWHGANPLALKGVSRGKGTFDQVDSAGMSEAAEGEIVVTPLNDVDALRKLFRAQGERVACFIFEPYVGNAGFIPVTAEFMSAAREMTAQYGALLILDEVITGFRFCASGVQRLYGVKPDLSIYGKIIGGGMPISAVAGRAEIMNLSSERAEQRVWFNGGTFSAHPLSLLAGKVMIQHLIDHEQEIYPALAAKGQSFCTAIEQVFADRGILACCTGQHGGPVQGGSIAGVNFTLRRDCTQATADDFMNPERSQVVLREQALKLGLLLHEVNVVHGLGAISLSHTEEDLQRSLEAYDAFAQRMKRVA